MAERANDIHSVPISWQGIGFRHVDYTSISLGNRDASYNSATEAFSGMLDDFAIWNSPLTATEWMSLARSANSWTPFTRNLVYVNVSYTGFTAVVGRNVTSFQSVTVFWNILNTSTSMYSSIASQIVVRISTDGVKFCGVKSGQTISALTQGAKPTCSFPASSLSYQM